MNKQQIKLSNKINKLSLSTSKYTNSVISLNIDVNNDNTLNKKINNSEYYKTYKELIKNEGEKIEVNKLNEIQKIKDWWKSRKDTAAIEGIVKRLNKDPEVVEFAKSKTTTGWKELLKKKLTGNEVAYINKVYRTHIKGEE